MKVLVALAIALWCGTASAQSITLSPAVVPLGGKAGASTQQRVTVFNSTSLELSFSVSAKDVVVNDGKRQFVDAGEVAGSIAATAVLSASTVTVKPGDQASVDVTVTLPATARHRAVVILFTGVTRVNNATYSIGALLTFDLAGRASVDAKGLQVTSPTRSRNAAVALPLVNDGTEPQVVRGAAAILGANGALVGRLVFPSHRLLPGEQTVLRSDYPGLLPAGSYRVVVTLEAGKQALSRSAPLAVR